MNALELDKQRVSLLLNINTLLIQKSVVVQSQIQQVQQTNNNSQIPKLNEILQNLLKRLHANLTCIGELSEKQNNGNFNPSKIIFPTILSAPPEFMEFNEYYIQLQNLFPEGVQFLQNRLKLQMQQQGQQQAPPPPQQQQQQRNTIDQMNILKRQQQQYNNPPPPQQQQQQFW